MSDIRATTYEAGVAVTPTDNAVVGARGPFAALYVGGGGNIQVTDAKGNKTISYAVTVGTVLPVQGTIVWSTNTNATNIVALYANPLGGP